MRCSEVKCHPPISQAFCRMHPSKHQNASTHMNVISIITTMADDIASSFMSTSQYHTCFIYPYYILPHCECCRHGHLGHLNRSEERRVGKECRTRWSGDR